MWHPLAAIHQDNIQGRWFDSRYSDECIDIRGSEMVTIYNPREPSPAKKHEFLTGDPVSDFKLRAWIIERAEFFVSLLPRRDFSDNEVLDSSVSVDN